MKYRLALYDPRTGRRRRILSRRLDLRQARAELRTRPEATIEALVAGRWERYE